jgi:hypothetical protein
VVVAVVGGRSMSAWRRRVTVRLDRDVVEVRGRSMGRDRDERYTVGEGEDVYATLEHTLRSSRLLRPGRACELGVVIESPRILYRTADGEGDDASPDGRFAVVMPEIVEEVLDPILSRRRVHGRAWFGAGPALRAVDTMERRIAQGPIGRGIIVDRSAAAVTVLLIDATTIRWARGAPADDPAQVAAVLLRRVGEFVDGRFGLHWWHLEDVARPVDAPARRREARELEARCHAMIGFLPRIPVGG